VKIRPVLRSCGSGTKVGYVKSSAQAALRAQSAMSARLDTASLERAENSPLPICFNRQPNEADIPRKRYRSSSDTPPQVPKGSGNLKE
jgi:hypothetical protein